MKNNIYLKIWRTWKLWRYEMQQSINFYPSRRSPSCKTASHRGKSRFGRWAMSKSSFFWTKISITFCKQYSRIEFCPDLQIPTQACGDYWRLPWDQLSVTLWGNVVLRLNVGKHCLYQAAFEDGSHISNPSSYLAGLISEYFQGAPRIPYKPVFLDGWSPGYVTFAEENQVIVIFSLTFNFNIIVDIVFAYFCIWVYHLCRRAQMIVS